jgi:beta-lactamase regulating signal transducer with metallopeptidase domain
MSELIRTIIIMSLSGSVLAALLFALRPLLRDRLPKLAQYYLWLVVVAALLVPFSKLVALPLASDNSPLALTSNSLVDKFVVTAEEELDRVQAIQHNYTEDEITTDYHYIQEVKQAQSPISSAVSVFVLIYPFGVIAVLMYVIISFSVFTRLHRRRNFPAKADETAILTNLCGNKRTLQLYRNPLAATPMLIGLFRPAIILPDKEYTDAQLRSVLLHELTHLRRKDILVKWFSVLACSLHCL